MTPALLIALLATAGGPVAPLPAGAPPAAVADSLGGAFGSLGASGLTRASGRDPFAGFS